MSTREAYSADDITITTTDETDLPDGWTVDHYEEHNRPVNHVSGYYLKQYESEHFLISIDTDRYNGERVHALALLNVKRDDDTGERLTALGTGISKHVTIPDDAPDFMEHDDKTEHYEAHEHAEQAAFQLAVDLMRDVNAGKYDDKRYTE